MHKSIDFFGSRTIFNKDKELRFDSQGPDAVLLPTPWARVIISRSCDVKKVETDIFFRIVYIQVKWIFEKAM